MSQEQEQTQSGQTQSQSYTPPEGIALDPITEVTKEEPVAEPEQTQEPKQ